MNTSNPLDGERIAGTVGLPLLGVELRVVDEDGRTLSQGAVGVLEVKGPNVFRGYWRQPEKTAAEFRTDGFYNPGDVATIRERKRVEWGKMVTVRVDSGGSRMVQPINKKK